LVLSAAEVVWPLVALILPVLVLLLTMPPYLRYLTRRGRVVDDAHKAAGTKVPSPAGPMILFALVVGEMAAFLFYGTLIPLAIVAVAASAFVVGMADDFYVLGGKVKPLLLLLTAMPLVFAQYVQPGVYTGRLAFPILGMIGEHFSLYTVLVIASIPIVSNAFNMMDSFNGQISGFALLTSLAVTFGIVLRALVDPSYSIVHVAVALPLVGVSLGFYYFNRFPSRAFDGDSGSLVLGTVFAALAVTGGVEIAAVVALIPAILNSFYILSSVRGFVERRRMSSRPTYMGSDGKLYASKESSAPRTLVRMVLLEGPLTEKQLVGKILTLTGLACFLSILTSILTWVR
jgi:UDP-N-acetylmuramyl pentapeptide phosphotransferase/UDP-N-acetylglucosamine-1-phosphate transferase